MRASTTNDGSHRPRVVVVGSGFGGFFAARKLQRADIDLVVVAPTDAMLYQPLLPDVGTGALDPRSAVVPLATTLRNATLIRGHVRTVDVEGRTLAYEDTDATTRQLDYDRLLLAPGSVTRLLDIPGLAEHAIGLKTITEAMYLRDHVLAKMEAASILDDPTQRRAALTFVVVGAGYAGVELTAQMARLTANLVPLHPAIGKGDMRWVLIDVAKAVMPELGPELGDSALELLKRRGVDVRLETSLTSVTDSEVTLSDDRVLDCTTVVWCAGVTPSPLIAGLHLPTTKGRLTVDPFLRVPDRPEVYAIGDAAAVPDLTAPVGDNGKQPLCPPTAQHAMRQAEAAARNILADLQLGRHSAREYRHHDLGLVVDLGGPDAAATPLGLRLRGRLAKLVTLGYHLYALPTVKRRIRVALDWALAGRRPDDVSLGMLPGTSALIIHSEDQAG